MNQNQGRRGRPKGTSRGGKALIIKARYFRLVVPNLQQFKGKSEDLIRLKGDTLDLIRTKEIPVGLQYYSVAVETHTTTGVPHLDILLTYKASRVMSLNRFNYLIKHGNLTRYKKLNQAILEYGRKQDPSPLTNLPQDSTLILKAKSIQKEPYDVLRDQMLKDPFHFNAHQWIQRNKLDSSIYRTTWSKAISLLKHQQQAVCNRILHDKPGFKILEKDEFKKVTTDKQYRTFTKNRCVYQSILRKIKDILSSGFNRPFKSKQLLLVSPPDKGKTSLALQIQKHISVYYMGVDNWFPAYRSNVYRMIFWDQFTLRTMPYDQLLKFLQGLKVDLQYKGGSVLKTDNQLIYMTSNMTLEQHICSRFKSEHARQLARANLRARIDQIILPQGVDLFVLLKLIRPVVQASALDSIPSPSTPS